MREKPDVFINVVSKGSESNYAEQSNKSLQQQQQLNEKQTASPEKRQESNNNNNVVASLAPLSSSQGTSRQRSSSNIVNSRSSVSTNDNYDSKVQQVEEKLRLIDEKMTKLNQKINDTDNNNSARDRLSDDACTLSESSEAQNFLKAAPASPLSYEKPTREELDVSKSESHDSLKFSPKPRSNVANNYAALALKSSKGSLVGSGSASRLDSISLKNVNVKAAIAARNAEIEMEKARASSADVRTSRSSRCSVNGSKASLDQSSDDARIARKDSSKRLLVQRSTSVTRFDGGYNNSRSIDNLNFKPGGILGQRTSSNPSISTEKLPKSPRVQLKSNNLLGGVLDSVSVSRKNDQASEPVLTNDNQKETAKIVEPKIHNKSLNSLSMLAIKELDTPPFSPIGQEADGLPLAKSKGASQDTAKSSSSKEIMNDPDLKAKITKSRAPVLPIESSTKTSQDLNSDAVPDKKNQDAEQSSDIKNSPASTTADSTTDKETNKQKPLSESVLAKDNSVSKSEPSLSKHLKKSLPYGLDDCANDGTQDDRSKTLIPRPLIFKSHESLKRSNTSVTKSITAKSASSLRSNGSIIIPPPIPQIQAPILNQSVLSQPPPESPEPFTPHVPQSEAIEEEEEEEEGKVVVTEHSTRTTNEKVTPSAPPKINKLSLKLVERQKSDGFAFEGAQSAIILRNDNINPLEDELKDKKGHSVSQSIFSEGESSTSSRYSRNYPIEGRSGANRESTTVTGSDANIKSMKRKGTTKWIKTKMTDIKGIVSSSAVLSSERASRGGTVDENENSFLRAEPHTIDRQRNFIPNMDSLEKILQSLKMTSFGTLHLMSIHDDDTIIKCLDIMAELCLLQLSIVMEEERLMKHHEFHLHFANFGRTPYFANMLNMKRSKRNKSNKKNSTSKVDMDKDVYFSGTSLAPVQKLTCFSASLNELYANNEELTETTINLNTNSHNIPTISRSSILGSTSGSTNAMVDQVQIIVPKMLQKCIEFLSTRVHVQGLFRVSGSVKRVEEMKRQFETNPDFEIDEYTQPHDVAMIVKSYFRELKEPLLTTRLFKIFVKLSDIKSPLVKLRSIRLLMFQLPKVHLHTLFYMLQFLQKVSRYSSLNQMTSSNLATCFAPNILRKEALDEVEQTNLAAGKSIDFGGAVSPTTTTITNPLSLSATSASNGAAGPKRKSFFDKNLGSLMLTDKKSRSILMINTKIVDVVEYLIEHQHLIWEVPNDLAKSAKEEFEALRTPNLSRGRRMSM